jgi:undecaprenyl-diphosphatase
MDLFHHLLQVDRQLFTVINQHWTNPMLDRFMPFISDPNPFLPFLVGGALALLVWGGFRGRLFVLLMALALGIGDAGIDWSIKHTVHRPRPYQAMEGVRMVKREQITLSGPPTPVQDGNSFTSGHACNNVALAFMACAVYGRVAMILWVWAALVSYSRIYTGSHYPSDILGSWMVATLYSWLIVNGLNRLWQNFGPQYLPKVYENHPSLFSKHYE